MPNHKFWLETSIKKLNFGYKEIKFMHGETCMLTDPYIGMPQTFESRNWAAYIIDIYIYIYRENNYILFSNNNNNVNIKL